MGKGKTAGLEDHEPPVPHKGDDRREALRETVVVDQINESLITVGRLYRADERAIELEDGKATQAETGGEEQGAPPRPVNELQREVVHEIRERLRAVHVNEEEGNAEGGGSEGDEQQEHPALDVQAGPRPADEVVDPRIERGQSLG